MPDSRPPARALILATTAIMAAALETHPEPLSYSDLTDVYPPTLVVAVVAHLRAQGWLAAGLGLTAAGRLKASEWAAMRAAQQ